MRTSGPWGSDGAVVKDMALTEAEFLRHLSLTLPEMAVAGPGRLAAARGRGWVVLSYRPLPPRRIGPTLSLPRLEVVIGFEGLDAAGSRSFVEQFDRAFQRGGG